MECKHCQHWNLKSAKDCAVCHRPLVAMPASGTERSGASLRLTQQCPGCGAANTMTATTCVKCGAKVGKQKLSLQLARQGLRDREITHYLICPPLVPFRLRDDERCVIGRSERANISLPGELVSRTHAAIVSRDGSFFLEDLGSANGTFHGGKKIETPIKLGDGDTISIGGFHLRYQVRQGHSVSNDELQKEISSRPTQGIDLESEMSEAHARTSALGGRLDEVPFSAVLKFLHDNARSGILKITSDNGEGSIRFGGGDLVAAVCKIGPFPSRGKEALLKLAALRRGAFAFDPADWDQVREINEPTGLILQEIEALED